MDFLEKLLVESDGFHDIVFKMPNEGDLKAHMFMLSARCPTLGESTFTSTPACLYHLLIRSNMQAEHLFQSHASSSFSPCAACLKKDLVLGC